MIDKRGEKMESFKVSSRLNSLPPYIFAKLEQMKAEYMEKHSDVIDLGVGDPDFPTQSNIVEAMKTQLENPENHRYPSFKGELELRKKISWWYKTNYNVDLDPEKEILILIGSKEGIAHIPLAFVNEGDYALVPDPGYPAYLTSILLAGGKPYTMPLRKENKFLPDLNDIPEDILGKTRLMYLNYPNNPTSALANSKLFSEIVSIAEKHSIVVCHDFAYSQIVFDNEKPVSFLSVPGAKNIGVEFHSFSKTYAMTGWRIGFVAGNSQVIAALSKLKSCIDSGVFKAVQYACIEGLTGQRKDLDRMLNEYSKRRDILAAGLKDLGWEFDIPKATYYFWVRIPGRFKMKSIEFSELLLKEKGLIVTPGIGFGQNGEGYLRISINLSIPKIEEAIYRLRNYDSI